MSPFTATQEPRILMIAFFDTNIYIDFLKGTFPKSLYSSYFEEYIIRVCPVVYQELIRGVRTEKLRKKIETLVGRVIFLPPPTTEMWVQAGELAAVVMQSSEERKLEKIQNDLLIALTARAHGATLITRDTHFKLIGRYIPFRFLFHP